MVRRRSLLLKSIDETHRIRCSNGTVGTLREEVYVDQHRVVVKYNLAFINSTLYAKDQGRVLGYDNAHGFHERHFMGRIELVEFHTYEQTLRRFLDEVAALKEGQ